MDWETNPFRRFAPHLSHFRKKKWSPHLLSVPVYPSAGSVYFLARMFFFFCENLMSARRNVLNICSRFLLTNLKKIRFVVWGKNSFCFSLKPRNYFAAWRHEKQRCDAAALKYGYRWSVRDNFNISVWIDYYYFFNKQGHDFLFRTEYSLGDITSGFMTRWI